MSAELESLSGWRRTDRCGTLRREDEGREVRVMGWVHRVRDHGGVFFLDVRDRTGILQILCPPDPPHAAVLEKVRGLGLEDVVAVSGRVRLRPEGMRREGLATGEVEVVADQLRLLNRAETTPFVIGDQATAGEDLRLEYRYLDLRSPPLQEVLGLRHRIALETRAHLDEQGFWEIETPMLVRPTPEGARDYLVPSRVHRGKFYALPQSPQLYKQLLMVAGMDRYFQIARCLRDEDLRADRQPEHTQIDIEMSFVDEEDVYALVEGLMARLFERCLGVSLAVPFPKVDHDEAMDLYGSDKPDLRIPIRIVDLSALLGGTAFRLFREALDAGGCVKALVVPRGKDLSRRQQEELEEIVRKSGAAGLARAGVSDEGLEGGVAKFLSPEEGRQIVAAAQGRPGDLIGMVAGPREVAQRALGALRLRVGADPAAGADQDAWRFLWVRRFPLFERDESTGRIHPAHHMFTMPLEEDLPKLRTDPLGVRARLYDLVLNGTELASGSIRIHRRDIQEAVMEVAGIDSEAAERRFGFLLRAFQFGAPPHGGIAIGLDRVVMLMAGRASIRDTIAFPKTTSAASLMDGSPSAVDPADLEELQIRIAADPASGG